MVSLRSSRATSKSTTIVAVLAGLSTLLPSVAALAPFEPAGNQVLFGAWVDTQFGYSDTPSLINSRLGYNVPVFQFAQDTPLPPFDYVSGSGGPVPESLLELSSTDAAMFLTVYPAKGFAAVGVPEFTVIANQILDYQVTLNRTVFLRYAPEMQGLWNVYGFQPVEFLASWRLMYNTVKAIAPGTIMVWAPNTPQGYPYGQTFTTTNPPTSAANQAALDTNGDGAITSADDALSPWYPGDAWVDWIGLSLYYKGDTLQDSNVAQTAGYCSAAINGIEPTTGQAITNWYTTYCTNKPSVACMFAESGAAYRPNIPGGSTNAAISNAWLNDCYSIAFLNQFPRLKMLVNFEYEKFEQANNGVMVENDYRLTNNTEVLARFRIDLAAESTRFSWASSRAAPTSISTPGAPPAASTVTVTNPAYNPSTDTSSSQRVAITATTRPRSTAFPRLFGSTSDTTRQALVELSAIVACGIIGAGAVMKWL